VHQSFAYAGRPLPGSAGGLNNSVNDPSGIGNAAKIQSPPPPSMAIPVVPCREKRERTGGSRPYPTANFVARLPMSLCARGTNSMES